jgi:hypothetical protein
MKGTEAPRNPILALRTLVALLIFLACAGCGKGLNQRGVIPRYQDEVGAAKLTVISVAPWEQVEPLLTPDFSLTATDALQKIGPAVRAEGEAYLRTFSAAVKTLLPTIPSPKTPEKPDAKTPEAPKMGELPSQSGPQDILSTAQTPMSESSRYRLALALYQEVQLLNHYISHVALKPGWKAFLVSMDVGLLSWHRRAEVDAQVIVTFVPEKPTSADPPWPQVITIIMSDDIELNQHSRQVKNAFQLALSLAGMLYSVQAAADVGRISEELLRTTGRDVNSLQLVASASPNALMVRFGAGYGVETRYQLWPQSRRVHALLLVPEGHQHRPMVAITHAIFRTTDGQEIPARPYADIVELNTAEFNALLGLGSGDRLSEDEVKKLWAFYHDGNIGQFYNFWACKRLEAQFHAAWTAMARLSIRSRWSYSPVILPQSEIEKIDSPAKPGERYAAFHDGKTIRSRIPGHWLSLDPGRWQLRIGTAQGNTAHLLPLSVNRVSDHLVEVTFPSALTTMGTGNETTLTLTYKHAPDRDGVVNTTTVDLLRVDAPPAPSPK